MQTGYWSRALEIGRGVYRDRTEQNVDEQAGPAYFATHGLSHWLFWQRLKWAARQIECSPGQTAVDFGCGFGLLLPHLRQHFKATFAVDLMPTLAEEFIQRWDRRSQLSPGPKGQLEIVTSLSNTQLPKASVDLIVAFDVLEHFESLTEIVDQLADLLKPSGQLLVSGPTETWLYRLGRRLVGYSGEYHHQTIYDVHGALKRRCRPGSISQLPPLLPLFLMSRWQVSQPDS